ncbi:hypothetical protein MSBR3_0582 [Methanosarcina barkeri 3]|uniref:Uncharacterized protein n=1 Tax=Methanosarcina barkeri 3 TaxID=1434107 RepID=A0A0E3WUX0_METBA|nr:hypothetical protein MSBR3_0582 [Methanosarcina barkeri 3]
MDRRISGGGAWWIERHWTFDGGFLRSMVSPNTSNIRERISLPTGAFKGPYVSSTSMPRASPSVGVRAIPRTRCVSSWVKTSMAICFSFPARSSVYTCGKWFSNNISTMLPRTEITVPRFKGLLLLSAILIASPGLHYIQFWSFLFPKSGS